MTTRCVRCESSGRLADAVLTSYWGHALCRPCAHAVAALLDEHDRWPAVPWTAQDEQVLADD